MIFFKVNKKAHLIYVLYGGALPALAVHLDADRNFPGEIVPDIFSGTLSPSKHCPGQNILTTDTFS